MLGFIDVSNMTSEQVRRMGHADDHDTDYQSCSAIGSAPARRNTVLQIGHSVSDVWAAACAAQRVNGGYYKEHEFATDDQRRPQIIKRKNREVMMEFLQNPDRILVEDVEAGEQCRDFLAKDITLRALKSKLTDFDQSVSKCIAVTDRFYTVSHRYELAVIASLPQSHQRAVQRLAVQDRLATTVPQAVGEISSKVQLTVEVISSTYSQNYGVYWIKAVTADNRAVFFARKNALTPKSTHQITGSVKRFDNGQTQLNRVKIG
jgi:hypothetical protein